MPRRPQVSRTQHAQKVVARVRDQTTGKTGQRTFYLPTNIKAVAIDDYISKKLLAENERVTYHKVPVDLVNVTYNMDLSVFADLCQKFGTVTQTTISKGE